MHYAKFTETPLLVFYRELLKAGWCVLIDFSIRYVNFWFYNFILHYSFFRFWRVFNSRVYLFLCQSSKTRADTSDAVILQWLCEQNAGPSLLWTFYLRRYGRSDNFLRRCSSGSLLSSRVIHFEPSASFPKHRPNLALLFWTQHNTTVCHSSFCLGLQHECTGMKRCQSSKLNELISSLLSEIVAIIQWCFHMNIKCHPIIYLFF